MHPTHSEFGRFEEKVETQAEKQFARVEAKIDDIGKAVARLIVTEERQLNLSRRVDELALQFDRNKNVVDERQTRMGERFDARVTALEHQTQRYLGISSAVTVMVAAAWALASKFLP